MLVKMNTKYLVLVILVFSCISVISIHSSPQFENRIVVVLDTYHKPALLNFSKAFEYLNESMNHSVSLYKLNHSLSRSTLSGVAIYVIPPSNKTFSDEEKEIIKSYVRRGGILILMGLDYVKDREFNSDIIILDDVLSSIPLDTMIHFNYTKGLGNTIIDPLSNDSYIHINSSHYTEPLKEFLGDETYNLILESAVLTVETPNVSSEMLIIPPAWVYALSGDGTILYFESGITIFAIEKYGDGYVISLGFSISLSDLVEPNSGSPWIDLGENKDFWLAVIKNSLKLSARIQYQKTYITILWMAPMVGGIGVFILSIYFIATRPRVVPKKKERKEVKISELLKEMRKTREKK